jgi:hypothetical protein
MRIAGALSLFSYPIHHHHGHDYLTLRGLTDDGDGLLAIQMLRLRGKRFQRRAGLCSPVRETFQNLLGRSVFQWTGWAPGRIHWQAGGWLAPFSRGVGWWLRGAGPLWINQSIPQCAVWWWWWCGAAAAAAEGLSHVAVEAHRRLYAYGTPYSVLSQPQPLPVASKREQDYRCGDAHHLHLTTSRTRAISQRRLIP